MQQNTFQAFTSGAFRSALCLAGGSCCVEYTGAQPTGIGVEGTVLLDASMGLANPLVPWALLLLTVPVTIYLGMRVRRQRGENLAPPSPALATEDDLHLRAERHRIIIETTREWIWEIRLDAGHVFTNPAIEDILGYPVDTILNIDTFDLLHPEDREAVKGKLPEFIEKRCGWQDWTLRWQHRDGTYRHLESNAAPVLDISGNLVGFRGVDRDITDRLEADRLLRKSFQLSADFMASIPSGFIIYRFEEPDKLYILEANPEAARLTGQPLLELKGAEFDELWTHPDDALVKRDFLKVVQTGQVWSTDYTRGDGDEISLALRARAFAMPGNRLAVAFEDILERIRTERELDAYRHRLEDLVAQRTEALEETQAELLRKERLAALGQIIATVSHELRNPLGTVRMSVFTIKQMLKNNRLEPIPRIIERADRGVVRCDRIIEELLDFTRARVLDCEEVWIDRWLKLVVGEIDVADGITREWDLNANVRVSIDCEQFRRAIINLVTNATQAMEQMESSAKTLTITTASSNESVEIWVQDTGPGMSAEVQKKIFEPLYSTKGFGVGLGVPIIREIVEAHGGSLHYESEVGKGTRAIVELPGAMGGPSTGI